ncbi:ECF transporter S component [Bacillus sp. T3]|uniref:ECF transporter S component n=1 Tax=Bacillus sp. T3 TaxID=467262 RepID=UPI0029813EAB|nr:ECF transporter S component [Bacillus sp. T3]
MFSKRAIISFFLSIVAVGLLALTIWWGNGYFFISMGLVLTAILLLLLRFENRKIEVRELVLIAVLAAVAAVGRVPFASLPSVQPTTFVIMTAGLVFGAESGFMIGAVAALASNMFLGQGPWTPWQMLCWGLVGFTAGCLRNTKWMSTLWGKIIFGIAWGFLFGWIMNIWGILSLTQYGNEINLNTVLTYYASSALFDFMHAVSNVFFIIIFGKVWIKNLSRFKRKYGLLE